MTDHLDPPAVVTGQTMTAANWNLWMGDNIRALWVFTTKGDIGVASAANTLARVAVGTDGSLWIADSAQAAGIRAGQLPIELPLSAALFPISGITAAGISQFESSAASPKPNHLKASYVSTSDTWLMWEKVLPSLMGAAPVLRIHGYMDTATTGTIGFGVRIAAKSDGDAGIEAKAFAATNTGSETVPGAAKTKFVLELALTNLDSWAKDDEVIIGVYRNTAVGGNASGICWVTKAQILYG